MVWCAVACHFTQLHKTPPKSTWCKVALDIITELKLSCSVTTLHATFEAVLKDAEHDGKIKHKSVRKNSSMIQVDSTEAQITADVLEKGSSVPQSLLMVNQCRLNEGLDEISESQTHGAIDQLMPLRAKLLKGKQGSTDPDSDWAKGRLNFCMQFLVRCGLAPCNPSISFLNPSNLTLMCSHRLTFWDETHRKVTVSGSGSTKGQIRFKRDENGALDDTGTHTPAKSLLHMKHTKEAKFLGGVGMLKSSDGDVGVRLPLLNYAEQKAVGAPEWDKLVAKEITRVKSLTGKKCGKWLARARQKDSVCSNDPVTMLSGVGSTTSSRLSDAGISTISNLLAHLTNRPRCISQCHWSSLKSKLSSFVKDSKHIDSNTPLPTDHRLASNPYQSLHGADWEEETSNVSGLRGHADIRKLLNHMHSHSKKLHRNSPNPNAFHF